MATPLLKTLAGKHQTSVRKEAKRLQGTAQTPEGPRICLKPRFKGSNRPRRFFGLKALHTTRGRDLAHDTPAGGEAGDHRRAAPLAHLSTIGPCLFVQPRPPPPPLLGLRSSLCSLGAARHGSGGSDGPGAGSRWRPASRARSAWLTPQSVRASPAIRGRSPRDA